MDPEISMTFVSRGWTLVLETLPLDKMIEEACKVVQGHKSEKGNSLIEYLRAQLFGTTNKPTFSVSMMKGVDGSEPEVLSPPLLFLLR